MDVPYVNFCIADIDDGLRQTAPGIPLVMLYPNTKKAAVLTFWFWFSLCRVNNLDMYLNEVK